MSKQALYDAFMAGAQWGENRSGTSPSAAFSRWYASAIDTGSRASPQHPHRAENSYLQSMAAFDRQLDIAAEGQRAAIYHGGVARKHRRMAGDS